MNIESLKIKTKTNYNWDDIVYINDFDVNLLEITKRESRIVYYCILTNCLLLHTDLFIIAY